MEAEIIKKYFPGIQESTFKKLSSLKEFYFEWNSKINMISRKDFDLFFERHVLHSLAIAKIFEFKPHQKILDIGTGGGFPGIPLSIFFPDTDFVLVDSIGKKIKVVNEAISEFELKNVSAENDRVENIPKKFHFITNRAVAPLSKLLIWTKGKYLPGAKLISLKGGELKEEIKESKRRAKVYDLKGIFEEPFFETKKIVVITP